MSVASRVAVRAGGARVAGHGGVFAWSWLVAALVLPVFLSGASGLIYQVLWVRILSLTFGVTTAAVTTVLAGFMAGLALGSYVAGRVADRVRQPLLLYGAIELGIGALGLLTPRAFGALPGVYEWLPWTDAASVEPVWQGRAVRLALAFTIVLVPTTLMGGTLPVVVRSSLLRSTRLHRDVGLLYAANTCGAILGTLAAGFVLIGTYGLQATATVAATGNFAAAGVAVALAALVRPSGAPPDAGAPAGDMGLSRQDAGQGLRTSSEPEHLPGPGRVPGPRPAGEPGNHPGASERGAAGAEPAAPRYLQGVVAWAYALSGFCALAYEVVWTRLLSLFFDGTTYPFTIMLATVLAGIAAGSAAASPLLSRRRNWGLVFAILEALLGLSVVAGIWAFSRLHDLGAWVRATSIGGPLMVEDQVALAVSVATIFPPAFIMGVAFPVAARLYATFPARAGSQIGTIYAANVCGAIFGSYVAGFLLIPHLGAQKTLVALAALNLLLGLLVLAILRRPAWWVRSLLGLAGAGALVGLAWLSPDLRARLLPGSVTGGALVWYAEDAEATVTVVDLPQPAGRMMYLNSRPQAHDAEGPVRLHRLLGHFPMLLHPGPQRVLVVGLGGGATAGAVAEYPGVDVDVVELVPHVIDAARFFAHVNGDVVNRPNVRLLVDDGRNFLLRAVRSGRRYDVITADVIRPHHAGAANLYSVEYYRLAAAALNDDGLMMQWLDTDPMHRHQLMLRSFLEVFPYAALWLNGDLLIGSKRPLVLDGAALSQRIARSRVDRAALAAAGIHDAGALLHWFVARDDELRAYAGEGAVLSDDRPTVEYFRSLPPDRTQLDLSRFSRRM